MSVNMEGKVAAVTGGSSGIGRAAALQFAKNGARVVVADLDGTKGDETVENIRSINGEALYVQPDVSKSADVQLLMDKTISAYIRLDYAFNNAGIVHWFSPIWEYEEEMWDQVININLKGVWLCMKYEIPRMIETGGGVIVNTSSVAGLVGFAQHYSYVASKFGVCGITKVAALEFAKSGIRVNAVCPGVIDTPMGKPFLLEEFKAAHPMGRFGQPEEIASTAVWLCSDEASFITGQTLAIDGGLTAS